MLWQAVPLALALWAVTGFALLQSGRGRADLLAPKTRLIEALRPLQRNGKNTPPSERQTIDALARELERRNPTRSPARSETMGGFWRMLYTSFETSPSAGQLGPFNGEVFQDLNPKRSMSSLRDLQLFVS